MTSTAQQFGLALSSAGSLRRSRTAVQALVGDTGKALDTDRPGVVQSLSNLGLLYHAQGRYADAEPLYKRALTIQEKALGTKILGVIPGDQAFRPLAEGGCPLVAR